MSLVRRHPTHAACAALCIGLALPNVVRATPLLLAVAATGLAAVAAAGTERALLIGASLLVAGWLWGTLRLDTIDRSPLASRLGMPSGGSAQETADAGTGAQGQAPSPAPAPQQNTLSQLEGIYQKVTAARTLLGKGNSSQAKSLLDEIPTSPLGLLKSASGL